MSLDALWAGWRMDFIEETTSAQSRTTACVLCGIVEPGDDEERMVVHRGEHALVVLNIYPYTSGHLMIVPFLHTAELAELSLDTKVEIGQLVEEAIATLQREYSPQGFNVGLNLGRAAGAGIAEHLHTHVVPRWVGDTNFMSTTASARVLPEALAVTRARIAHSWQSS